MRVEPSKLAQLVIAYHEKFGRYVPAPALRRLDARDLAPMLQDSLGTGWGWASPSEFSPRGCIVREENPERGTPTKESDDEWPQ